ncbi:MAG TPA: hypothetical protein VLB80_03305 [Candidatus Babeliales bacterium]|nr:hypothetical protein [Candidatus Babeliales bacterium]
MKSRNIVSVLCASIVYVSNTCPMLIPAVKRIPRSLYLNTSSPVIQKRSIDCTQILQGLVELPIACVFLGVPALAGCAIVGLVGVTIGEVTLVIAGRVAEIIVHSLNRKSAYKYVNAVDACSSAYVTKSFCKSCVCSKDGNSTKFLENIDRGWPTRMQCLEDINKRYNQCCLVESEVIDNFWFESKNAIIDIEKYRNKFGLITHKKECLYNAIKLMQQDMPNLQKKSEKLYAERLGLLAVSEEVKNCVVQQEKINEMNKIITKVIKQHHMPIKRQPKFKQLNNVLALKQPTEIE